MTDDEWDALSMLLDKGFKWREQFGKAHEVTYRTLLEGYDGEQIAGALRALVARGQKFGPTPGEIIEQIRQDPSMPTFDEALTLIRHALRAYNLPLLGDFQTEAQMIHARHRRVLERAEDMHPDVRSFLVRRDLSRLMDEVAELDGEYGAVRRRELESAWEAHVEACAGRDVAALVAPRRGGGLAQLDPLAALGVDRAAKRLPAGSETR